MDSLEKKVLKTACANLLNSVNGNQATVQELQYKVTTMKRGINDAIAMINTLMEDDPDKKTVFKLE